MTVRLTAVLAAALAVADAVPGAAADVPSDAAVRQTIDAIVAGAEYRRLRRTREAKPTPDAAAPAAASSPRRAEKRRSAEPRTGGDTTSGFDAGPLISLLVGAVRLLVYAALAAAVLGLLVLVIRRLRSPSSASLAPADVYRSDDDAPSLTPGVRTSDEYLQQALAQARAGRHREAIRLLLLGAMSFLETSGLIRYRKGLTNRDYLRAASREAALHQALEPIVIAFDEVYYGRRGATPDRFEECLQRYRAAFGRRG